MFVKLFALYPPRKDAEAAMRAYIDETREVHPLLLSHALKELTHKRASPHLPSVFEILKASALISRRWKRIAEGRDPDEYNPRQEPGVDPDAELDVWRWIHIAPEVLARNALPPGEIRREPVNAKLTKEQLDAWEAEIRARARKMGKKL